MLAYNQERFIAQAIESAVRQETNFDYEIVIGEDCSTDRTREIVSEWQRKYPDRIRSLLPTQNLGIRRNFVQTRQACKGQYVAVLEGDDFWTSATKLQQQVDFLDSHPDYAICFHNVKMFWDGAEDQARSYCRPDQKQTSTLEDLLQVNFIPTCSVMVRNGLIGDLPAWTRELKMLDWPLFILNARHGGIGYLNESMGAYRLHPKGLYSGLDPVEQQLNKLKMFEALRGRLGARRDRLIKNRIFHICTELAQEFAQQGNAREAKKFERRAYGNKLFGMLTRRVKAVLRSRAPKLFSLAKQLNETSQKTIAKWRSPDSAEST